MIFYVLLVAFLFGGWFGLAIGDYHGQKVKAQIVKNPESEMKYYMMTIQRHNAPANVIFYFGSLIRFILIEESQGRFYTAILFAKEITKEEYDYYHYNEKAKI